MIMSLVKQDFSKINPCKMWIAAAKFTNPKDRMMALRLAGHYRFRHLASDALYTKAEIASKSLLRDMGFGALDINGYTRDMVLMDPTAEFKIRFAMMVRSTCY